MVALPPCSGGRNGYQAALMAPTEILAQQHASPARLLEPLGMAVELSLGSQPEKEKKAVPKGSKADVPRAVGTMPDPGRRPSFAQLGLVITTTAPLRSPAAQALSLKGQRPHVARHDRATQPRTLTLTLYGDL